ncbi:hypothetical protein CGRA01v4_05331 [Colletotrichum graminicola]|nr:hypothetical protein CGRA01v4_05331 [Colletotrichum graminicola]
MLQKRIVMMDMRITIADGTDDHNGTRATGLTLPLETPKPEVVGAEYPSASAKPYVTDELGEGRNDCDTVNSNISIANAHP